MQHNEIRCGSCNKLFAKGSFHELEIKCTRCGTLNLLKDLSLSPESHRASSPENAHVETQTTAG
jgi:phage FluMu protein Com